MSLTTDRGSQLRLGLYFTGILTLLAVYLLPQTNSVVREDMTTALRVCGLNPPGRTGGPNEAYAAAHPDDDAMQVALARSRDPRKGESQTRSTVRYLAPLLDRYPRSVLVRAAIVRYATGFKSATAAERKEIARAAAEGERLEPDNAVFPTMVWVLESENHTSPSSSGALFRAAAKTRWDEHLREEVEGRWRLAQRNDRELSGAERLIIGAAIVYPQYAQIREAAKGEVKRAARLEASERIAEGIEIRHALMRVGAIMRSQSTTMIGNLVAVSIASLAAKDPGGRTRTKGPFTNSQRAKVLAAYVKYLVANSRSDEAEFARREFKAGDAVRAINIPEPGGLGDNGYLRARMIALLLLMIAAFTLLSARIAALLARAGCAGDGRPIRKMAAFTVLLMGGVIIVGLALRLSYQVDQAIRIVQSRGPEGPGPSRWLTWPWSALVVLSGPILLKAIFLGTAVIRRRPIVPTVVQGFRRFATPLAAVLVLCYGVILIDVAHRDHAMGNTITKQIQHEGRYYAQLQGKKWPE